MGFIGGGGGGRGADAQEINCLCKRFSVSPCLGFPSFGAMCGVIVSMSAFPACHQC